jgi:ferredoxin
VVHFVMVATQMHGKHSSITIEELCFLCGSCRGVIFKTVGATELDERQFCMGRCEENLFARGLS